MYRRWSGNCLGGRKMLRLSSILILFLYVQSAFACWKLEGSLGIDGETWKMSSKIEHDKEYIFPMGPFIFKLTVFQDKTIKNLQSVKYVVQEKKGTTLSLVTSGEEEEVEAGKSKEIYAKGEEGQPHSLIILKLTDI